jgi:hypothetical protein
MRDSIQRWNQDRLLSEISEGKYFLLYSRGPEVHISEIGNSFSTVMTIAGWFDSIRVLI